MLSMLVSDFLMNFFKIHDSFLHFFISTKKNHFQLFHRLEFSRTLYPPRQTTVKCARGCHGGGGGVLLLLMLQIIDWHNNCIQ